MNRKSSGTTFDRPTNDILALRAACPLLGVQEKRDDQHLQERSITQPGGSGNFALQLRAGLIGTEAHQIGESQQVRVA